MVSSSPEFSITKPHLRKRDKPLRTYGRQPSTPEAQSEPPSKKARILVEREKQQQQQQQEKTVSTPLGANGVTKSDDAAVAGASESRAHKQDASAQNKAEKPEESLKKGSILSYFKPTSQKVPKAEAPSQQLQDLAPEESSPSPQSSPKQQPGKRKPRLLRIRATTHETSDQSTSSSQEPDDIPAPKKRRGRPPLKSTVNSNTLTITQQATTSNQDTTTSSTSSPSSTENTATTKPKKNKLSSPAIQTTLNISAQAAFSECKICNTVWNPLYPDDVKYHIKTHKAVLRAEKKRKLDEL